MPRSASRSEDGFTLMELVIGLLILGIIMIALASALFVGLRTTTNHTVGLQQANAEQFLANWLQRDVAAACDSSFVAGCRASNPEVGGAACGESTTVFAIDILPQPLSTTPDSVAYVLDTGELKRVQCGSVAKTTTIARNVTDLTAVALGTGVCAGQFQVTLVTAGQTTGIELDPKTYTLCARRRTG